jgi:hypothetical protein
LKQGYTISNSYNCYIQNFYSLLIQEKLINIIRKNTDITNEDGTLNMDGILHYSFEITSTNLLLTKTIFNFWFIVELARYIQLTTDDFKSHRSLYRLLIKKKDRYIEFCRDKLNTWFNLQGQNNYQIYAWDEESKQYYKDDNLTSNGFEFAIKPEKGNIPIADQIYVIGLTTHISFINIKVIDGVKHVYIHDDQGHVTESMEYERPKTQKEFIQKVAKSLNILKSEIIQPDTIDIKLYRCDIYLPLHLITTSTNLDDLVHYVKYCDEGVAHYSRLRGGCNWINIFIFVCVLILVIAIIVGCIIKFKPQVIFGVE